MANKQITFEKHSTFKARASFISTANSARSHKIDYFIKSWASMHKLYLMDWSDDNKQETILELHHMEEKESITPANPLQIKLSIVLKENEVVIPITLGIDRSEKTSEDGALQIKAVGKSAKDMIIIEHIPDNPPDGRANPNQSLKLSFLIVDKSAVENLETLSFLK